MKKLLILLIPIFLLTFASCEWEEEGDEIPQPTPTEWENKLESFTAAQTTFTVGGAFYLSNYQIKYTLKAEDGGIIMRGPSTIAANHPDYKIEIGNSQTDVFREIQTTGTTYQTGDDTVRATLAVDQTQTLSISITVTE